MPVTSLSNATPVFGELLDQTALTFLYPRLEIAGVVSGNLDVFDPFLALDARLRL